MKIVCSPRANRSRHTVVCLLLFFFLNFLVFSCAATHVSQLVVALFSFECFAICRCCVVLLSHHHFFCRCLSAFCSSQLVPFVDASSSCSPPLHHEAALVITMCCVTLHTCLKFMPCTPVVRMPHLCYAEQNHAVDSCSMPCCRFTFHATPAI